MLCGAVVGAVVAATRRRALSVDLVKSRGDEAEMGLVRTVPARGTVAGLAGETAAAADETAGDAGGAAAVCVDEVERLVMGGDGSLDIMRWTKDPDWLDIVAPGRVTFVRADVLGETWPGTPGALPGRALRSDCDNAAATLFATAAATAACERGGTTVLEVLGDVRRAEAGAASWAFWTAEYGRVEETRALAD